MRNSGIVLVASMACVLAASAPARANTYSVVIDANATWSQAQAAAVLAGGYLATITSASENTAVVAAIAAATPPSDGGFWINLKKSAGCCYVWDNGETTCYGNFFNAEPNDGFGGPSEDRGHLIWSSNLERRGRWNDAPAAGYTGLGDVSRAGYVIEFGPTDPAGPCGACIPPNVASHCNTPPPGAITKLTRITGTAAAPGVFGRTIIDILPPQDGPSRRQPAKTLATYNVSAPVPNGSTSSFVASVLRDSINRQVGSFGFAAQFISPSEHTIVRMFRPTGNYSITDDNTAPGMGEEQITGSTGSGPALSGVGSALLVLVLLLLGGGALWTRRRHAPQD